MRFGYGLVMLLSAFVPMIAATASAAPVAYFDHVRYSATQAETVHGTDAIPPDHVFNPVVPGFQPDPSVVRVGDDFYLVNSTFAWFPGIPVYHSRDLVNWRQIGNVIDRASQMRFSGLGITRAIFAPTIEHIDGTFYVVGTCVDCGGNFIVTATNPAGPWSDPHWLPFDGIDPSLFADDDGRTWILNNGPPEGAPHYDGHRAIWIQQISLSAMAMVGPRTILVDKGTVPTDRPIWVEGPHIYRRDGYYYLLTAEGGTADQHSATIYRANRVTGPYRPGPSNPILTQRDLPDDRLNPVQATGHADMVELADGRWWALFLGTRPYAGQRTNLGRETFLLPVTWRGGWPSILPARTPMPMTVPRPDLPRDPAISFDAWLEGFALVQLAPDWLTLGGPIEPSRISLTRRPGSLALTARPAPASPRDQPAFVGRRLRHHHATVETRVTFTPMIDGDAAGLMALTDETHFLFLALERSADGSDAIVLRQRNGATTPPRGNPISTASISGDPVAIDLRFAFAGPRVSAAWRGVDADGAAGDWSVIAHDADASILATIDAGMFTGALIGPNAWRREQ